MPIFTAEALVADWAKEVSCGTPTESAIKANSTTRQNIQRDQFEKAIFVMTDFLSFAPFGFPYLKRIE